MIRSMQEDGSRTALPNSTTTVSSDTSLTLFLRVAIRAISMMNATSAIPNAARVEISVSPCHPYPVALSFLLRTEKMIVKINAMKANPHAIGCRTSAAVRVCESRSRSSSIRSRRSREESKVYPALGLEHDPSDWRVCPNTL
jgi:hypothetical protein